MTPEQQRKLDMTAVSMLDAFASNRPEVIMDQFDHRSFSKRLGKSFYQYDKVNQSLIMGMLMNLFAESVAMQTQQIEKDKMSVVLVDTSQKGPVSQVLLQLRDSAQRSVNNYIMLYLKENDNKEFSLVNMYNVFGGRSFGQQSKDLLEIDFENKRIRRKSDEAGYRFLDARYLEKRGQFEQAYHQMDSVTSEFRDFGQFASYRTYLAGLFDTTLYVKELQHLKQIIPNDQSKKYYDCIINSFDSQNRDQSECLMEVEQMLLAVD